MLKTFLSFNSYICNEVPEADAERWSLMSGIFGWREISRSCDFYAASTNNIAPAHLHCCPLPTYSSLNCHCPLASLPLPAIQAVAHRSCIWPCWFRSMFSAVCLFLFLNLCVCLCLDVSMTSLYVYIRFHYVLVCPSLSLSFCCLSFFLSDKEFFCLTLWVFLSDWLSVGLSVYVAVCQFVCLPVNLSIHPSLNLYTRTRTHTHTHTRITLTHTRIKHTRTAHTHTHTHTHTHI